MAKELDPKAKKKVEDLKTFSKNPELAKLNQLQEISGHLETLATKKQKESPEIQKVSLEGISVVTIKGDKGDPFKYDDFTSEQIEGLKVPGAKGDKLTFQDLTPAEVDSLKIKGDKGEDSKVPGPRGLRGIKGKDGKTPVKNIDYFDGENGSPDTASDIKTKLETLKGDERLSVSAIKGIREMELTLHQKIDTLPKATPVVGGISLDTFINGVEIGKGSAINFIAGANVILAGTNTTGNRTNITITSTGGGGGGSITLETNSVLNGSQTLLNLVQGSNITITDDGAGNITIAGTTAGTVTAVTGTANRITSTGGATPAIDISASYVGQSSITTLGTITTGVWNGTAIANANLANSAITVNGTSISLGASATITAAAGTLSGTTLNSTVVSSSLIKIGLSSAGFVKTDSSGNLSVDTNTYITGNQTITLTGAVTGSGTTSITTTLASGVVGIANLSATGTPSSTTFLRGDNTWATPAGSGGGVSTVASADGSVNVTGTTAIDLAVVKAPKWTTARNLAGNSVDGSANVAFANKFIVQGTTDAGLTAAQFLGALATGILKNTTATGVLSIAIAADFPTLNQSTTGNAATATVLATPRAIAGHNFDGSSAISIASTDLTDTASIALLTSTQIFTNKRVTKRTVTEADATSWTPAGDSSDLSYQSNSQTAGTLTMNAPSGTPTNGQSILLKIKSTNVQAFSWNAIYVGAGLPTASTGGGKIDYIPLIYDSVNSKWDCTLTNTGF